MPYIRRDWPYLLGRNVADRNWANDNGVAVMKWLAAQKSNPGFVNVPDDAAVSKFGNGDVAAIETGPWNYPDSVKALGEDKIGVAVYPKVKIGDQEVQQKAFMGVKLYAVNQKPAKGNKERIIAAYKLASFLTSEKSQENQFATRSIVPSNKNVQASEAVTSKNEVYKSYERNGGKENATKFWKRFYKWIAYKKYPVITTDAPDRVAIGIKIVSDIKDSDLENLF